MNGEKMFKDILDIYEEGFPKIQKTSINFIISLKNKMQNIKLIYEALKNPNYKINHYNIFLIKQPKYRIVMSLNVKDKVINHYVTRFVLMQKLSKYLDDRNVATRKKLGTEAGIKLVKKYIEEHKKYEKFYILKLDISKYFYTIDHEVLKHMIKPKLNEFEYHYILSIIDSTNESYINQKIEYLKQGALNNQNEKEISKIPFYEKGKGLPIGKDPSVFVDLLLTCIRS